MFHSRDVKFNETFDKVEANVEDVQEQTIEMELDTTDALEDQIQEEQERQGRERRPPDRYGEWVYVCKRIGANFDCFSCQK